MNSSNTTFYKNTKSLEDPNIFIGDTGATCYTTNSKDDFCIIKKVTKYDNIVDASGNNIERTVVGDISNAKCNKVGREVKNVIIKDIVHIPRTGCSLLSLTKRLDQ